jgi:hypothetical protein
VVAKLPPTTANQTDKSVTHNKLTSLFCYNILNTCLSLLHYIPTTNPLIYWSVYQVFANCSKEDKIYPLATAEIAKA